MVFFDVCDVFNFFDSVLIGSSGVWLNKKVRIVIFWLNLKGFVCEVYSFGGDNFIVIVLEVM